MNLISLAMEHMPRWHPSGAPKWIIDTGLYARLLRPCGVPSRLISGGARLRPGVGDQLRVRPEMPERQGKHAHQRAVAVRTLLGRTGLDGPPRRMEAVHDVPSTSTAGGVVRSDRLLQYVEGRGVVGPEPAQCGDRLPPGILPSFHDAPGPEAIERATCLAAGVAVRDPRLEASVGDQLRVRPEMPERQGKYAHQRAVAVRTSTVTVS